MNSSAEEIKARYVKVEREADSMGRVIGVRRLRPSQQLKINEMVDARDPQTLGYFNVVASVCEVDNLPITFPKNRGELDSMVDQLDKEGLDAAGVALQRLVFGDQTVPAGGSSTELTKNSVLPETEKSES